MAKQGHTLFFLGGEPVTRKSVFEETRSLSIPSGPRIVYDSNVQKRWITEIESFNPDIVHAHNILAGHFLLSTELPVVFDDHEVLSKQPFMYASRPFIRRMAAKVIWREFPKWEKEMAERFPVITISEGLANYYRQFSSNVGVAVNTPTLSEIEWLENPPEREGMVYIGSDFSLPKFNPYRDMSGLQDLLKFEIVNGLPHNEMMERITHFRIGLTPFKPHPFQCLCNSNKNYEYLHAGLQVVLQKNFAHIFTEDPYVHPFTDYSEIVAVVETVPEKDPDEIMKHAREQYVWENQEKIYLEAYKSA